MSIDLALACACLFLSGALSIMSLRDWLDGKRFSLGTAGLALLNLVIAISYLQGVA